MVQILQRLNGSSDAELKEGQSFRYTHHVEWITTGSAIPSTWKGDKTFEQFGVTFYIDLSKPKPPPPGGLIIYKGSFAATLSRSVAEFIIQNQLVKDLIEWLSDTFVPDESLWTTVLFNKDVLKLPSLMDGKSCLAQVDKEKYAEQWISRYQLWPDSAVKCKGKWVHGSCVLGVKDLPHLRSAPQLFAHKFYLDFEPAAFFCMLQLIKNRTEGT
uniref:Uncharacterized protein n=1 Tax=Plectus sambesii TaxID=2011161 RepID=A0A914XW12_9BILA